MLFNKKIPNQNRRILLFALPVMILLDSFIAYKVFVDGQPNSEAQNFAFTSACKDMQHKMLKGKAETSGKSESQLNHGIVTTCTCISETLMNNQEFPQLEQMAKEGAEFFAIADAHTDLVVAAMNKCTEEFKKAQ